MRSTLSTSAGAHTNKAPIKPASILVVDDEPMARQMFKDLLEAHGFRVITVARGAEAFSFLR